MNTVKSIIIAKNHCGIADKKNCRSIFETVAKLLNSKPAKKGKMLMMTIGKENLKFPKRHFSPKDMLGSLSFVKKTIGNIYIAIISTTTEVVPVIIFVFNSRSKLINNKTKLGICSIRLTIK